MRLRRLFGWGLQVFLQCIRFQGQLLPAYVHCWDKVMQHEPRVSALYFTFAYRKFVDLTESSVRTSEGV